MTLCIQANDTLILFLKINTNVLMAKKMNWSSCLQLKTVLTVHINMV